MPASDGLDNFVGIGSPCEGFRFGVVFDDEAIDCCLQVDDRQEDAAFRLFVSLAKKPSTALSQDADVGVKWNVQRGCLVNHWRTFGCLWVA